MQLSDIQNLARTARIAVSDEEAQGLLADMAVTVEYIDVVNKLDLPGSEYIVPAHRNACREDVVTNEPGSQTETLLAEVPSKQDGYVKVKKIL